TVEMMRTAMANGSGGDLPENNLEAIIVGLENCTNCKDIILIADNMSSPRDMELLKTFNKPIHIILCGAQHAVNVDYLNLAYFTGGSIHTVTKDYNNLENYIEGDKLRIQGRRYKIQDGQWVYAPE